LKLIDSLQPKLFSIALFNMQFQLVQELTSYVLLTGLEE